MSEWQTLAEEWVGRADEDIALLVVGLHDSRIADRTFGYHAQQAIEKLLKAMVAGKGVEPRHTHDLGNLADSVADLYGLQMSRENGPTVTWRKRTTRSWSVGLGLGASRRRASGALRAEVL